MLKFAKKKTARGTADEKSTFDKPRASVPMNGNDIPSLNLDNLIASGASKSSRNHQNMGTSKT